MIAARTSRPDIYISLQETLTRDNNQHISLFQSIKSQDFVAFLNLIDNVPAYLLDRIDFGLGLNMLLYACRRKPVDFRFINTLLDYGVNAAAINPKNNKNALHYLLKSAADSPHDLQMVVGRLVTGGASVDLQEAENANTPLHYACRCGNDVDIIRLIASSANVNLPNQRGKLPRDETQDTEIYSLIDELCEKWQLPASDKETQPVADKIESHRSSMALAEAQLNTYELSMSQADAQNIVYLSLERTKAYSNESAPPPRPVKQPRNSHVNVSSDILNTPLVSDEAAIHDTGLPVRRKSTVFESFDVIAAQTDKILASLRKIHSTENRTHHVSNDDLSFEGSHIGRSEQNQKLLPNKSDNVYSEELVVVECEEIVSYSPGSGLAIMMGTLQESFQTSIHDTSAVVDESPHDIGKEFKDEVGVYERLLAELVENTTFSDSREHELVIESKRDTGFVKLDLEPISPILDMPAEFILSRLPTNPEPTSTKPTAVVKVETLVMPNFRDELEILLIQECISLASANPLAHDCLPLYIEDRLLDLLKRRKFNRIPEHIQLLHENSKVAHRFKCVTDWVHITAPGKSVLKVPGTELFPPQDIKMDEHLTSAYIVYMKLEHISNRDDESSHALSLVTQILGSALEQLGIAVEAENTPESCIAMAETLVNSATESKRWNRSLSFSQPQRMSSSALHVRETTAQTSSSSGPSLHRRDTDSERERRRTGPDSRDRRMTYTDSRDRRLTYTDVTHGRLTHNSTPFSSDLNTQSAISSTYSPLPPTDTCDLHDEVGTLEAMRARLEWLQVYDPNEFNVQNRVFQVRVGEWMAKVRQPATYNAGNGYAGAPEASNAISNDKEDVLSSQAINVNLVNTETNLKNAARLKRHGLFINPTSGIY